MKTSELSGAALDWAVCKVAGLIDAYPNHKDGAFFLKAWTANIAGPLRPSSDWANGGPIIEREKIAIDYNGSETEWYATMYWRGQDITIGAGDSFRCGSEGPTPLTAAMRCFVVSRLGEEVDIPKELL